jgi:hypothetical protein
LRVVLTTGLVLALAAIAAPAAMAHYPARGKACKPIQFQAQTDSGASGIYAKRVKCRTARRMVRAYHNGDKSPRDFSWRSRAHDDPQGLAHRDVKCTRGERRVTFALY